MQRAMFKLTGTARPSSDADPADAPAEVPDGGVTARWSRLSVAIPPVATLAVMLWGISGSSYWRDEAATMAAVHRSFPQLLRLLGFVDAVHGAYYSIIWVVVRLFGIGEFAVRLPSALAMAAAAAGIAVLGRRLVSPRAGLAAGLVFAVLPNVSWYGQDARSPALVTALAVWTTYFFVRILDPAAPANATSATTQSTTSAPSATSATSATFAPSVTAAPPATPRAAGRRRWLICYAAGLVLLGLANVFALLLIVAHAATLAARVRRDGAAWRPLALRWLASAATAIVVLSPFLLLTRKESWQIRWTPKPGLSALTGLRGLVGPTLLFLVAVLIVVAAVGLSVLAGQERLRRRWPAALGWLCLPWLVLPPLILLVASQVKPMYEFRYVVFCVPAAALLIGTALVALGRAAAVAGLAVIVVLGLPAQLSVRAPAGHGDNIRQLERIVAANQRPGDVVFYQTDGAGTFEYAYSYGLSKLPVINQKSTPVQAGTLTGWRWSNAKVQRLLLSRNVPRLWVIGLNRPQPVTLVTGLPFHQDRAWQLPGIWVVLYVR